jgi:alpha-tubulin suppressor-like RCC1 family protein
VYGAGNNSHNQCGVPAHEEKERPAQVIALQNERIIDITCGFYHSFFLSERGLFACGKSSNGQLGVGEVVESSPVVPVPQELFHFEKIELVAAGYYTSFVLTDNNTLYAAGENDSHQLGNFDDENLEGRSVTTFTRVKLPTMISAKRLVCVSSGIKHTLLLTSCGHVYGIGVNDYNQLGMLDSSTKTFVQVTSGANYIFAGPYYTVVTLKDTECPPIGWGDNSWDNENGNRVSEKEFVGWPNNITQITGILYCTGATKDKKVYKIFGRGSDEVPVLLEYPEEIKNQVIGKNVHLAGGYSSLFVYFTSESKNVSSFITKLYACQKRENFVDLTILNGK